MMRVATEICKEKTIDNGSPSDSIHLRSFHNRRSFTDGRDTSSTLDSGSSYEQLDNDI